MQALPPSDVKDLFARAMIGLDDNNCSPPDNPIGWTAIAGLHRLASREVLDIALACCLDSDPLKRRVGANVLGQLGHSKPGFEPVLVEERFTGLMNLLEAERSGPNDPNVLSDACVALGHLHDARAIPALPRVAVACKRQRSLRRRHGSDRTRDIRRARPADRPVA